MSKLGNLAVIKIADSGDTLRDLSPYLKGGSLPQEVEAVETTHLGDNDRKFIPGLGNATASGEGDFDTTVDGYLAGIRRHADQAIEYYPQGTGSGNVKYAGVGMLTSYEINDEVGDAGKFSFEFQVSGGMTRTII